MKKILLAAGIIAAITLSGCASGSAVSSGETDIASAVSEDNKSGVTISGDSTPDEDDSYSLDESIFTESDLDNFNANTRAE